VLDCAFLAFNLFVTMGLVAGLIAGVDYLWERHLSFLNTHLLDGQPVWLQAIVILAMADLVFYVGHRLSHEVTFLWWFHAMHHSQASLNPYLQHRGHPVEYAFFSVLFMLPALVLGAGSAWGWLAIPRFLWAYMVHSDLRTNLGPIKHVLVTPQYHRVHHSLDRRHYNLNYGGLLIIWDRLFGTMHPEFDDYPDRTGIVGYPIVENSYRPWKLAGYFIGHLVYPFAQIWRSLHRLQAPKRLQALESSRLGGTIQSGERKIATSMELPS
jgi:sterol desaturase/sphingolipid hydroxylase (fatty acid hydroxylase superfamily)